MKCSDLSRFQYKFVRVLTASLVYFASVCLIFGHHHHRLFFSHSYFGTIGDPQIFIWCFSWWPYAITHRLNPFITHVIWAPDGINLTWTGCVPAAAIAAWPITAKWGPIVSFNTVTLAAPALGATAAFILSAELTDRYFPSLVGGWLFGLSSYEIGQLMGHLHMNLTACVPALAWLAVLRYKDKLGATTFIVAAAGLLTFQFGTSTEIFATATLFGFVALIFAYILQSGDRARLTAVATGLAYSYLVCLVIVSPYLYYMIKETSSVPPLIQPQNVYVADLMNYVVPTQITAVNGAWAASIAGHFTGNDPENGAYLGFPLLMIIVALTFSHGRDRWTWFLLSMFVVLVLCSFGPYLHVKGRSLWPMPWWFVEKLPLLRQALPVRFSLYTSLVAAIIAALWLASLAEQESMLGYMLALLAVLTLIPNIRGRRSYWLTDLADLHIPAFFSNGDYKRVLKPDDNIIALPYGHMGNSMLWQTTAHLYFRMAGGYVTAYTPPAFARWPVVTMFFAGKPEPELRGDLTHFCEEKEVRAILLAPDAAKAWDPALRELDWERIEVGGIVIYRIPSDLIKTSRLEANFPAAH
jgi:hypothetical protein